MIRVTAYWAMGRFYWTVNEMVPAEGVRPFIVGGNTECADEPDSKEMLFRLSEALEGYFAVFDPR